MDVTDIIGRFGPWQRRIFYVLLYRAIPAAFVILNVQFFSPDVDHWCARGEVNVSVEEWRSCCVPSNSKCEKYLLDPEGVSTNVSVKCDVWEFESSKYTTNIKQQWNLVCDRAWMIALTYTMITMGNFVSYIPAGHLSDRYGRRKVCLLGMILVVVVGVAGVFSPNIEFFLAIRFISGMCYGLFQTPAICLFIEAVGPEYRMLMALAFMGTWGLGIQIMSGLAVFITDWRILQLITYVPLCVIPPILIWKFVPESARWLLTVGRDEEAEKIICEAAKVNGIEILDRESIMRDLKRKIKEDELADSTTKHPTFFDLFRTPKIRRMTIVLYFSFFLTVFIYYGFTLTVNRLGGSLHLNMFIVGLTESVSSGIFILEAKFMTRRRALLLNFVLSGLSFFLTLAVPHHLGWLRVSIAMIGRASNSIAYALLWLFAAEIFPTNLRTVGVSGGMTAGRLGSILATFMDEVARVAGKNTPIAIFGCLSILTSALFLLLPETRDKHLPDTVKESERLPESVALSRVGSIQKS